MRSHWHGCTGRENLLRYGYPTRRTRRSVILSGRARQQRMICVANASSYFRSCCAVGGSNSGGGHWTLAHRRWLAKQAFEHAAQQIVFQEGIDAIEDAAQRLHRLEQQLAVIVPSWSMAPVVAA